MQLNLQDAYLGQLKKENLTVVVYLVNGFQLKGTIKGFDNFTIFLENEGKMQMVYKHSVTTVNPIKSINLAFLNEAFKDAVPAGKAKAAPSISASAPIPSASQEII